jgi:hypothetical protein
VLNSRGSLCGNVAPKEHPSTCHTADRHPARPLATRPHVVGSSNLPAAERGDKWLAGP